jgi:hypothetical protein
MAVAWCLSEENAMRKKGLALPLLFLLCLGCTQAPRRAVARYDRAQPVRVLEVESTGTYALFATHDIAPQASIALERGERIGFVRDDTTGAVFAIAGDRKPLPVNEAQTHYWVNESGRY